MSSIIGAGIAGASSRLFRQPERGKSACCWSARARPGYHTTGRFRRGFIPRITAPISSLRWCGRAGRFLTAPPSGFTEHPILTPLGLLTIANASQSEAFESRMADRAPPGPGRWSAHGTDFRAGTGRRSSHPKASPIALGSSRRPPTIDVHGLHQGYLRGLAAKWAARL